MWIRTQDRLKLVKCITFEVCRNRTIVYGYTQTHSTALGEYSTHEKALKVLDVLQKYIGGKTRLYIVQDTGNSNGYHVLDNLNIPMGYCKDGIFQMPQDDEVE